MRTLKIKGYALVTGASQGLGKAFAVELAKKGFNLILVALPGKPFDDLKCSSELDGVETHFIETDLSVESHVRQLASEVNQKFELQLLINNAGLGGSCGYVDVNPDKIVNMINVNVTAMALLTRLLLPNLLKRKSYILNVSSMAAFSPMGYKTVYPATKAFVHHFTRGLYQELRHTSVFVSVVNPGPMATNSDIIERIKLQGWRAKIGLMSPEKVASIAIRKLFKRDTLIMLGWANGLNWVMLRFIPIWIRLPLLTHAIKRELKST